jgi:hypothetical protein
MYLIRQAKRVCAVCAVSAVLDVNARKTKAAPEEVVASCSFSDTREGLDYSPFPSAQMKHQHSTCLIVFLIADWGPTVTVCVELEAGQSYVIVPSTLKPGSEG